MYKSIFVCCLILIVNISFSQKYFIKDSIFAKYIREHYEGLMEGDSLNILSAEELIINDLMDVSNLGITNLDGIQFFKDLRDINCSNNKISDLNMLPESMRDINCSNNRLTKLPYFPRLYYLDCSNNSIEELPYYENLEILICRNNQIKKLGKNTRRLFHLDCSNNLITILEELPVEMNYLKINNNQIKKIKKLPIKLNSY